MNLRNSAAQILARVIGDGQSLTQALQAGLPMIADAKDRAFVQAACYGVLRYYQQLDFLAGRLLSKPLKAKDADIRALLLLGLYQLRHMRVKPHAAVSETVAACKHKPWAKALVNAVLRQYLRDADQLQQACSADPEAGRNHPAWLIARLEQCWLQQAAAILAANDQPPPLVLRVNLLRGGRDDYLELLADQGIAATAVAECPAGLMLEQPLGVELLPGFAAGRASVQDAAAQLAAELMDLRPGHNVLDLCAAPGGKTAAILESQPGLATLLAVDVDAGRLARVRENLDRLGLAAELLVADASAAADWAQARRFDRILLDAPCSGLGVIRRHPDIKLLRRDSDIAALQDLQRRILDNAWTLLSPGGLLLYATCSVLKQENEEQVAAFLGRHADAGECPIAADWGEARPHGRQILTGDRRMDGFYYARLVKKS